ncbi:MAG: ATP-binding protein [Lachnospiraceae bacterium]|nr:ATP-binding protein [Lachnospiraceae bacterium]
MGNDKDKNKMLTDLFFRLLPVQVLIVAMGAVNSIVDGTIAGRFIDAGAVGVVGLYFSLVRVMDAFGGVMLGGTSVICGRLMGTGDINKTKSIFSLNLSVTFMFSVLLTAISFAAPGSVAAVLGANDDLKPFLVSYILGYAVGIVPQMLAQQIASFLQMERQSRLGYAGIAGMMASNIILDIVFVAVLGWGPMGLALATAVSNWVYFLILVPYYFTKKAQLRYRWASINWPDILPLFKIGFPGALLVMCIAVRSVVINRILIYWVGEDALSAQSAYSMISGLFIAFALGVGATVRMLCSVSIGEEDRRSLHTLMKISFSKALPMSVVVTLIVMSVSAPVTSLFFPDTMSEVYRLTRQLFLIFSCCIPLIVLCQICTNYLQAAGHHLFVDILSVFDGFFSMVIPSVILAPILGALGVWLANPIGIVMTLLLNLGYVLFINRHFPKSVDEWLLLREDFGVPESDCLYLGISDMEGVSRTAEAVHSFCDGHDIDKKRSYYSALCLEEMAGNIVRHGFYKDRKKHVIEAKVIYKNGEIILRIKDDCIPFNPKERAELLDGEDITKNIGLRMVSTIADQMEYQNLMGLNVLTIKMEAA